LRNGVECRADVEFGEVEGGVGLGKARFEVNKFVIEVTN
jgi:hypothetical protein